jgi:endonuclease/exonuclease/phosphatase family metal-dependent hydrolase
VGSYNIMRGGQVGLDMSVLAKDIKALSLDVVGLQEVDVRTLRVGGRDTLAELAESAGYEHYFFCKAIDYQGGGYGTAILSHYPIKSFEIIPLYTWDGMEGRAVGHAVLDVNGTEVDYYNTHLSYEEESVQQKQFLELNELVKDKTCFVITADFNTDEDRFYDRIEHSIRANHRKYNTFPGSSSAIDDIVLSYGWSVVAIGREVSSHSDHYLLWAEIRLDGGVTPGT